MEPGKNRGMGMENIQKEFSMKDAYVHTVSSSWNTVTKETLVHFLHNFWLATVVSNDYEQGGV